MAHDRTLTAEALDTLRSQVEGAVLVPGDSGYDDARVIFTPGYDERPAVVVQAAGTEDVRRVVDFARSTGADLAVRCGGHSSAGHSTVQDGLVLDLRRMTSLDIDAADRTAWAQAGITAAEYTSAVGAHGLATGFGDTGSVGVAGITLGGGVGFLSRKHGLTIDSLLAAEVVTADGRVLEVDDEHHADLFWAIRGGGGNFGVVTRMKFRLHDVGDFIGGLLVLPATPQVIAQFVDLATTAPDELSTIANVMPCPPMPMVPEDVHGETVVFAQLGWSGDPGDGQKVVDGFRALATPHADLVRPMPYADMFPPLPADYRPTAVAKNMYIRHVDEATAATILDGLAASDAPMRAVQIRVLGGAIADVPVDATAYAHRTAPIMVNVAAFYDGAGDRPVKQAWVDDVCARLDHGVPGVYVNFLGREGDERIRDAYPGGTWDRLRRVKAAYDPANLFHLNQNIPPLAASTP